MAGGKKKVSQFARVRVDAFTLLSSGLIAPSRKEKNIGNDLRAGFGVEGWKDGCLTLSVDTISDTAVALAYQLV